MAFIKGKKYLRTVKVDLSENLNSPNTFVEFREPTTGEAFSLRVEKEDEAIEVFKGLLPSLLINHNFYNDEAETEKMSNQDVVEILYSSYPAFTQVLTEYTTAVFQSSKQG